MDTNIIIRPKGRGYVIYLTLKFVILVGLMSGIVFAFIEKNYWWLFIFILPLFLLILQIREVILYKMRLTDTAIYLAANRDLFIKRHKNLKIKYKGLKSIQYFLGMESIGFISAIALRFEKDKLKYLDVLRFSDKQIDIIMNQIKDLAEKQNLYEIEIKPDEIQKGYKRNNKESIRKVSQK